MYTHKVRYTKRFLSGALEGVHIDVTINTTADAVGLHAQRLSDAASKGKECEDAFTSATYQVVPGSIRIERGGEVAYAC